MDNLLNVVLLVVQFIVTYILPPVIFVGILAYATFVTFGYRGRPAESLPRVVGYVLGYLLLVGVIVLKANGYLDVAGSEGPLGIWTIVILGMFGFLVGSLLMFLFQYLIRTRVAGFIIMSLVGSTSISLFLFVFLSEVRGFLVVGSVSFLIGLGVYAMLFPESLKRALGR